jgi:microcystin-dependent protein
MFHIGEIILVAFDFVPSEFMLCNGQTLQIQSHQALFSLLGITHGGNGVTTFALPNMTAPANMQYIICINGIYPSRS